METGKNRIKEIEYNGFTVFDQLIPFDAVETIKKELSKIQLKPVDYSACQLVRHNFHGEHCPQALELIAHPEITGFLKQLFGDKLICTSTLYSRSLPGHPGIVLHTDSQPYGSEIFGVQASAPVLVRMLVYLDDLTKEKSPLRVIPRSHLSLHADANPYSRYLSHPDEVEITCKAGTVVIINQKVFHGNGANTSSQSREMVAFAFRPEWAGPIAAVEEWPHEWLVQMPAHIRKYFGSLNSRKFDYHVKNRPEKLQDHAPGLNLNRWW